MSKTLSSLTDNMRANIDLASSWKFYWQLHDFKSLYVHLATRPSLQLNLYQILQTFFTTKTQKNTKPAKKSFKPGSMADK